MDQTGEKLLNLMFREGESICVSPNKYGYHSIPLPNAFQDTVKLVSTKYREGKPIEESIEEHPNNLIQLVALNPIQGWREDANCTAYRNFLIEMDTGPLPQQLEYIKRIGMPYSAAIFSGGKSLHFLISLDTDLPSEKVYRKLAEWILGIATLTDQNCKNPSRSIRIPGAYREPGNPEKKQRLVEFKGPVPLMVLVEWLKKHPDAEPKEKPRKTYTGELDLSRIKPWAVMMAKSLSQGDSRGKGRNKAWFAVAYDFALAGVSEEQTVEFLSQYFVEERSFKEREWLTTIRSAFKTVYEK